MLKRELSPGIIEYVFEPNQSHQHFGNRITALINKDKVMLLDTGYGHQATEVLRDLDANHLKIEGIIISHFHDDHMEGLKVLPRVPVYGSSYYKDTLDMWIPKEEHQYFTPTVLVKEPLELEFGGHKIEIIPSPGHSLCTVLVKINDQYLHVADELMFSNHGEPLLPCITKKDVERHVQSINQLKDYLGYTFIFAHGDNVNDKEQIENTIENLVRYLNTILGSSNRITVEEATKECTCTFLHKEWHELIYR